MRTLTVSTAPAPRGVLEKYDRARSRYIWHLCDAVLTAGIEERAVVTDGKPKRRSVTPTYQRAQRVINAAAATLPRAFARLRELLLDPDRVPFAARLVKPLSAGSGVTVFVMQHASDNDAHVLKIYRKSLGRQLNTLLDQAEDRRARYNRLASWYTDCGVVLPTHFLVLNGPVLGLPSLAYVQPYVTGELIDVFGDVSEPELLQLLLDDRALLGQFSCFVDSTMRVVDKHKACVDLVGRNNLVIMRRNGEQRLVLLDYGILDFRIKRQERDTLRELRRRLEYLRRLTGRINGAEAPRA